MPSIKNSDLKVGDYVIVDSVRSKYLDFSEGKGWVADGVIVEVLDVNDITFWFEFNGERHSELKDDVKKTKTSPSEKEKDKIKYAKDSFRYLLSANYGI